MLHGILTKRQATLYIINRILCGAVMSPLTMTSLAIHMLQNRAEFSNTPVAFRRHNLKTQTMSMRMQQTRQKLSRQNLSLDFATDNCDFVC